MSNEAKPPLRPLTSTGMPVGGPTGVPARVAGAPRTKRDELELLINSRNPIITVESSEEQRFMELLERAATELGIPLYVWSVTTGVARAGGAALDNSDQPEQVLTNITTVQGDGIFLLKDFGRYCDNYRVSGDAGSCGRVSHGEAFDCDFGCVHSIAGGACGGCGGISTWAADGGRTGG